jgi:prepilin-type N-terminal cleavage/methylation domain-containing protein
MRTRSKRRAVTLIEVMVAVAVLTFGVYAVYDQFRASADRSRARYQQARGRFLAHQKLEELRACDFSALESWRPPESFTPAASDASPPFRYRVTLERGPAAEAIGLGVEVRWDYDAAPRPPEGYAVRVNGRVYP